MTPIQLKELLQEAYEQIRHLHHLTTSYAEHKALGKFYEELDGLTDTLIETYQGKYGRINGAYLLNVQPGINPTDYITSLRDTIQSFNVSGDPDIANIIADIIGLCNHTIYLLTLK